MTETCTTEHHPSHGHEGHAHDRNSLKLRLKIAFSMSIALVFIEGIGGWWSGSLSLLADALHVLADAAAVGIVLLTSHLAESPRSARKSFGYYRLEILSALFNGVLLIFTTLFIFRSAYMRWASPVEIQSAGMLVISVLGLIVNIAMLASLRSHHHDHINLRSAYLHILGDTLSSVAVVASAIIIQFTGINRIDILASIFVALIVVSLSGRLVYDSIHILLEGSPKHLDPEAIQEELRKEFSQIINIHDFHLWEITSNLLSLTAHIEAKVDSMQASQKLIEDINTLLKSRHGIRHTTLQIESH